MGTAGGKSFLRATQVSLTLVAALFAVEFLDRLSPVPLDQFGIVPRTARGLVGIACAPLLHVNFAHLLANAAPLFVLLVLLFWDRHYLPGLTLGLIWIVSGLGTWLIGRGNTIHVGASSVIFGLVAYLIVAGFLMRSWRSAIIGILVLLFYGGIFYGALPQAGPISWEGHLSGAVAGVWAAQWNHE